MHGGITCNALFFDGHVQSLTVKEMEALPNRSPINASYPYYYYTGSGTATKFQ